MPKIVTPLTDTQVKRAKSNPDSNQKLFDGGGLYLLIDKSGSKFWRLDYTRPQSKKRNTLAVGVYPAVSLADARLFRDNTKKLLAQGIDPSEQKKKEVIAHQLELKNTFCVLAKEWLSRQDFSEATIKKSEYLLKFAYDDFGNKPVSEITPKDVLDVCRKIETKGNHETAKGVKVKCGQVFRYGVGLGICDRDVTQDLRGVLKPPQVTHRAAIIEPNELGHLLVAIDNYQGKFVTQIALKIAPLVFVRPIELRTAKWSDIDLEAHLWKYTPPKTKKQTGLQHIVPLSNQVMALLLVIKPITEKSEYVFPAVHTNVKPMSENTINQALRRLGYSGDEVCGHGFRATARTILDEVLGYPLDVIEQQLAHTVRDMHGRAYNRTKHLDKRIEMMQRWSDYLDDLKKAAN